MSHNTTTPPDFTEQARQLVNAIGQQLAKLNEGNVTNGCLIFPSETFTQEIASFASDAATRGQALGIARAAQVCDRMNCEQQDSWKHGRTDTAAYYKPYLCASKIRTLSPDLNYLDRVRNEVRATLLAELSGSATEIDEKFMDDLACGFIPSNERHAFYSHIFEHLEQRLAAVAYKAATAALEQAEKVAEGYQDSIGNTAANIVRAIRALKPDAAIGDDKEQQG